MKTQRVWQAGGRSWPWEKACAVWRHGRTRGRRDGAHQVPSEPQMPSNASISLQLLATEHPLTGHQPRY